MVTTRRSNSIGVTRPGSAATLLVPHRSMVHYHTIIQLLYDKSILSPRRCRHGPSSISSLSRCSGIRGCPVRSTQLHHGASIKLMRPAPLVQCRRAWMKARTSRRGGSLGYQVAGKVLASPSGTRPSSPVSSAGNRVMRAARSLSSQVTSISGTEESSNSV